MAAYFDMPADELLSKITSSVHTFIEGVAALLADLREERRAAPDLLRQPSAQWKSTTALITPLGRFDGFADDKAETSRVDQIGASEEMLRRINAAGLTRRGRQDIHPSVEVWNRAP